MSTSSIKLMCPNCGRSELDSRDLYANILYCPYCGTYSYYDAGIINKSVIFGIVSSEASTFSGLKEKLSERIIEYATVKQVKELDIKHIRLERFLVPVREINVDGTRKYIPLIAIDSQAIKDYDSIYPLLKSYINKIDEIFALHTIRPIRVGHLKDEIDLHGHIYRTHIMPIARSKFSVDEAYGIDHTEILRIIYVPMYKMSFNDKKGGNSYVCFGDNNLTGFYVEESAPVNESYKILSYRNRENRNIIAASFILAILSWPFSLLISGVGSLVWVIVESIHGTYDGVLEFLLSFILIALVLSVYLSSLFCIIMIVVSTFMNLIPYKSLRRLKLRNKVVKSFA